MIVRLRFRPGIACLSMASINMDPIEDNEIKKQATETVASSVNKAIVY